MTLTCAQATTTPLVQPQKPAGLSALREIRAARLGETFTVQNQDALELFVESTDPSKADGLVKVTGSGGQHQYSAYQRDAWYDHGRLLDAAQMCART
jgi:hypothetical protein